MKNIAILASGNGTNAQNIMEFFEKSNIAKVKILLSNNQGAYALTRAQKCNVDTYVFTKTQLYETNDVCDILIKNKIDLIILAGFLWIIPKNIINAFPNRVINIHPALLPKYGGKGMYGMNVHQQVVKNREPISGITIHFVDEIYDNGNIIAQFETEITPEDNPETVAQKIHDLEQKHFPQTIKLVLEKLSTQSTSK